MTLVVAVGGLVMWPATSGGFPWDRFVGWPLTLLVLGYLFLTMAAAWRSRGRRVREMAA